MMSYPQFHANCVSYFQNNEVPNNIKKKKDWGNFFISYEGKYLNSEIENLCFLAKSAHHTSVHRCIFNLVVTLYLLSQYVRRFQQQLSYINGCSLYKFQKLTVV